MFMGSSYFQVCMLWNLRQIQRGQLTPDGETGVEAPNLEYAVLGAAMPVVMAKICDRLA
jgi:hypothetical protein